MKNTKQKCHHVCFLRNHLTEDGDVATFSNHQKVGIEDFYFKIGKFKYSGNDI